MDCGGQEEAVLAAKELKERKEVVVEKARDVLYEKTEEVWGGSRRGGGKGKKEDGGRGSVVSYISLLLEECCA